MGDIKLILGDSLDKLKLLPDNSVDSVVTDPPYGLGKEPDIIEVMTSWIARGYHEVKGRGFMGKEWDSFVPQPILWKEVYRVLKPGGHMLVACGTRTQDWMASSLRFAGFEIRDIVSWVYGCLTEDTEIFTERGWKHYHKIIKDDTYIKDKILIYDTEKDTYRWELPERWNEYQIDKDTVYRISSDRTDQLVSRNHRCIVERNGELVFRKAETLEFQENIPILEGLPEVSNSFSCTNPRSSKKKQILRKIVLAEESRKETTYESAKGCTSEMRCVWKRILQTHMSFEIRKKLLQLQVQWYSAWERLGKTWTSWKIWLDRRKQKKLFSKDEWFEQSCLEGWGNILHERWKLWCIKNKICKVSYRIQKYVKEQWLYTRIPFGYSKRIGSMFTTNGMCASYRSRSGKQRSEQSDVVCEQFGSQEFRSGKTYSTTLATVTPIEYTGIIFCPTVSTGAFVARRNGKVFITGNSGFPKSMDISKQIDKQAGADRERTGNHTSRHAAKAKNKVFGEFCSVDYDEQTGKQFETVPATDEAKEWDGFGTALKPAMELWTLCRKPISEKTVVDNILKWGTGALNIDGCRIELNGDYKSKANGRPSLTGLGDNYEPANANQPDTIGRFPANIIFDEEAGQMLDEQSGISKSAGGRIGNKAGAYNGIGVTGFTTEYSKGDPGFGDIGGASRFFYCPKTSRTERDEGLDGFDEQLGGGMNGTHDQSLLTGSGNERNNMSKNFHPTVKPVALMSWLIRLITPPNGVVLDPFMGSGSTGKAAVKEDMSFIGIELEPDYFKISDARIKWQVDNNGKDPVKPRPKKPEIVVVEHNFW